MLSPETSLDYVSESERVEAVLLGIYTGSERFTGVPPVSAGTKSLCPMYTLATRCTIYIQITMSFDGVTRRLPGMVKHKRARCTLLRSTRRRNSREP